jgi:hypothetical protein
MFILMMINPLKKQNKFYFDIERVLLKLNFFMIYLSSTITQERLNGLAILYIEKKLLDEIDLDDISDDFVSQNVRRYF